MKLKDEETYGIGCSDVTVYNAKGEMVKVIPIDGHRPILKNEDMGVTRRQEAYYKYLRTPVWKQKRQEAIDRDGGRCRLCNSSKKLHVHHRRYPKILGEEPLEDLTTLCEICHNIFHNNQVAKKTIKVKNNGYRSRIRTNKKFSIPRLKNQVVRILRTNGLLPLDCTVKFKEAVKIICLKTNQQFPMGDKYKQVQIASAYIA